jgi:hypothetical protein
MQNLQTTPETTSSYLSKEDLKTLLISKQDKIKKLVSEVHTNKKITLSVSLNGEYMISTARKKLTPSNQVNIEHWHYSYTVKVDKDTAKKRTFLSIVTKQLLDGICDVIDRITWYVGLTALSI